jgi:hypothetical protein
VERHALAQVEGVLEAVLADLVVLGQLGHRLGAAQLVAQETLVDLAGDAERLAVAAERRVEHGGVAGRTEDEGAAGLRLAAAPLTGTGFPVARGAGGEGDGGQCGRGGGQHALWSTLHRRRPAFSARVRAGRDPWWTAVERGSSGRRAQGP